MAKNKKFKNQYVITIEDITTNEFMSKLAQDMLEAMVMAININYKQVNAKIVKTVDKSDKQ